MKTRKVEEEYLAAYETFANVAMRLPRFIEVVYNAIDGVRSKLSRKKATPSDFSENRLWSMRIASERNSVSLDAPQHVGRFSHGNSRFTLSRQSLLVAFAGTPVRRLRASMRKASQQTLGI
ncbi:hypothetical protein [Variovorax sp. RO1]|uniref:hypothetical protein n=1 Tax=Variovorax sp. RO1 TaxID=2066034 RepID=UPI00117FF528|nr:hypothetical protein [Variovorax sp. RO1]